MYEKYTKVLKSPISRNIIMNTSVEGVNIPLHRRGGKNSLNF